MTNTTIVDYVWIDGYSPTASLRAKSRVLNANQGRYEQILADIPDWNFDGSSTGQAEGHDSDVKLKPVRLYPVLYNNHFVAQYIALCECYTHDGKPLESNTRHLLADVHSKTLEHDVKIGFEQEYVMMDIGTGRPIGFPDCSHDFPRPQGPYYCGVGANNLTQFARQLSELHMKACLDSGILLYGTNAEVMLGQWEFQVGLRDLSDDANPLRIADDLWVARYLLERMAESANIRISYDAKPVKGDWNGSGGHTAFSTAKMRDSETSSAAIEEAVGKLSQKHDEHIASYGEGIRDRLTGAHETCRYDRFKSGSSDRGASIRVPPSRTYIEDRRPCANLDPYVVARKLISTICL